MSGITNIKSPWVVVIFSVVFSLILFLIISIFVFDKIMVPGLFFSTFIPAVVSYPVASILIRNYSKIERQKSELERLNHLNQKLFSVISHDIRAPLATMSMLIQSKISELNEQDFRDFKQMTLSIEYLLKFLDELLTWSKKQLDQEPLVAEPIDTEFLIRDIIKLYQQLLALKQIDLKIENLSGTALIDKGSYTFAIRNILQNAIKYTPESGWIRIKVDTKDSQVITTISDSGVGISDEKISKILTHEEYNSEKGTNNEIGTGFGLKTSISYLEKQNGALSISSELNKGTDISITVPSA